jgi:hypothetical protein
MALAVIAVHGAIRIGDKSESQITNLVNFDTIRNDRWPVQRDIGTIVREGS